MLDPINCFFGWLRREGLILPIDCYSTMVPDHPSLERPHPTTLVAPSYTITGFGKHYGQFAAWQEGLKDLYLATSKMHMNARDPLNVFVGEANGSAIHFFRSFEEWKIEAIAIHSKHSIFKSALDPRPFVAEECLQDLPQSFGLAEQRVVQYHRPFSTNMRRIYEAADLPADLHPDKKVSKFFEKMGRLGGLVSMISVYLLVSPSLQRFSQGEDTSQVTKDLAHEIMLSAMHPVVALGWWMLG